MPSVRYIWSLLVLLGTFVFQCAAQDVTLRGTLVTPNDVIPNGAISISKNKIGKVGPTPAEQDGTVIETDSFIFPGLIDLHNHITWNFFPRWKPNELFNNRYEWQQRAAYKVALDGPHAQLVLDHGLACDADRFGEIKAIIGGSTSVVGGLSPSPGTDDNNCIIGLARNLDSYSGFDGSVLNKEKVRYEVFPFEMKLSDAMQVHSDLETKKLNAFIVHVAEGKPTDASAAREFRMLVKKNEGYLRPGVSIIHGVALSKPDFVQMQKADVGLIWSPRSNIELYGATTDVRSAKEANVKIALAPDWSPSGSDGLVEELKYASSWNEAQVPSVFATNELVAMATTIPAQLAGASDSIGSLRPGYYADLLLVRKTTGDPYQSLLHLDPGDVRLVMIGGVPVYGDEDLMKKLLPNRRLETLSVCGKPKDLYIEPQAGIPETGKTFKQMSDELSAKLASLGTSLAELAPCQGTNLN